MLGDALALAHKGMAVFPCRPRDKRPATANGLKEATRDPDIIRQWWRQEPQLNLAIATGAISRIFVVDIDGLDAEGELRKLEAKHGELPATVQAITPRPGRHIYFQWPQMPVHNSAGKIAPGVDVRGDGGYVLAPPSIHPSGRKYCWSVDTANAFAAAPDWLLAKITGRTPPAEWRTLVADGVAEGQRNNTLTRLCGYLLRRHVDPAVALALLQGWNAAQCRPPLPAGDVAMIVDSIAGRELKRRNDGNG
jgi:hypothetical protein